MLHYFAKRFFHPILITTSLSASDDMKIFVVSDQTTYFYNATIEVFVYKWKKLEPIYTEKIKTLDIVSNLDRFLLSSISLKCQVLNYYLF